MLTTAFAKVGLSGDYGVAWFLTRLVGTAQARELLFLSPRLDASAREKSRARSRRRRERRRARGLTAAGKPVVAPAVQAGTLRAFGHHPPGCICHDCLFPPSTTSSAWIPPRVRFVGASA